MLAALLTESRITLLRPIWFCLAWLFIGYLGITLWQFGRDVLQRSRIMHQIPCAKCAFFTNDHRLKCTLHPRQANSEAAITCRDYEARGH